MGKFSSVVDWGWTVLHFKQRKLAYFRSNYLKLSALSVTEATLARAYRIGWTKLVYLLDMCTSEAELVEWIDRVETQNLRDEDLKKTLALHHAKSAQACLPGSTQTIDDASVEIPAKLKRIRWGLMFTKEDDLNIFVEALKAVRKRLQTDVNYGEAAALMATSYLACLPRSDEGGVAVELEYLIEAIEKTWGVRLQVIKSDIEEATDERGLR